MNPGRRDGIQQYPSRGHACTLQAIPAKTHGRNSAAARLCPRRRQQPYGAGYPRGRFGAYTEGSLVRCRMEKGWSGEVKSTLRHSGTRIAMAASMAAAMWWMPACGAPSSNDGPRPHCMGFPHPCAAVTHAFCDATPGCHSSGDCTGYSSGPLLCSSYTLLSSCILASCSWKDTCVGVPLQQCSGATQEACVTMGGCSWGTGEAPPSGVGASGGGGYPGTGGIGTGGYYPPPPPPIVVGPPPPSPPPIVVQPAWVCGNNAEACSSDSDCTCGLECVTKCTGCSPLCGFACQTGSDCASPDHFSYCDKQPTDQTGICH